MKKETLYKLMNLLQKTSTIGNFLKKKYQRNAIKP